MIPIICVKQWCYKGVLWKRIWQANTPLDIWAPIVKWLYIIGITSPSQNGIISHLNFSTGSDVVNFCLWGYFIWFYISQANYVIATFVMQCCVLLYVMSEFTAENDIVFYTRCLFHWNECHWHEEGLFKLSNGFCSNRDGIMTVSSLNKVPTKCLEIMSVCIRPTC